MRSLGTLILISFTLTFFALPNTALAAKVHGVFRVVKGKVKVKSGKTGKLKRARIGQKVFPLDTIITAKDSRAKIVMSDSNEINISPDTKLTIEKYEFDETNKKAPKNVLLKVLYGKVRNKVSQRYNGKDSKFQVKTPSAVAGVRGTDFFTSYSQATKQTQVVTFKGQVAFGLPGVNGAIINPVQIRVGQMASNLAGRAPAPPIRIPKNQLVQMDRGSAATPADMSSPDKREPANNSREGKKPDDQKKGEEPKGRQDASGDTKEPANGPKDKQAKRGQKRRRPSNGGIAAPLPGAGVKGGLTGADGQDMPNRDPASLPPPTDAGAPPIFGGPNDVMGPGMEDLPGTCSTCGDTIVFQPDQGAFPPPPLVFIPDQPYLPDNQCEFCQETIIGQGRLFIRIENGP